MVKALAKAAEDKVWFQQFLYTRMIRTLRSTNQSVVNDRVRHHAGILLLQFYPLLYSDMERVEYDMELYTQFTALVEGLKSEDTFMRNLALEQTVIWCTRNEIINCGIFVSFKIETFFKFFGPNIFKNF